MNIDAAVKVSVALGEVSQRATALANVNVPVLFGRKAALAQGAQLAQQAAHDAQRAVSLLGKEKVRNEFTVMLYEMAASVGRQPPTSRDGFRQVGEDLLIAAEAIRTQEATHFEPAFTDRLHKLFTKPPSKLTVGDVKEIIHFTGLPPMRNTFPVLEYIRDIPAFDAHGKLEAPVARSLKMAHLIETQGKTAASAYDEVNSLVKKPVAELTEDDWLMVHALTIPYAKNGFYGRQNEVTVQLLKAIAENANPAVNMRDDATRVIGLWNSRNMAASQQKQIVNGFVTRDPTDLDAEEWKLLRNTIVASDSKNVLTGPRYLGEATPFVALMDRAARGEVSANHSELQRYFSAWRIIDVPDADRQSLAKELFTSGFQPRNNDKWMTLQGLLDTGLSPRSVMDVTADFTPSESAEMLRAILHATEGRTPIHFEPLFRHVRDQLSAASPTSPAEAKLYADAIEKIDVTIMRMHGSTPRGSVQGYLNNPDYAELGQLRSNLALMNTLNQSSKAPTTSPAPEELRW